MPIAPAEFFSSVQRAFDRAAQMAGQTIDCDYHLGGYRVRLRLAGAALFPILTPAFSHLAAPGPGEPDLSIGLWDTASTGIAPPPPPWDYEDFAGGGLIRPYTTERFATFFQLGTNALSVVDRETNRAFQWVKTVNQIPSWEMGAPLRVVLSLWLNHHGRLLLHAGAVGLPDGGVLLVGAGGSGKSNAALSTLTSDLGYAGDDFTLLALEPRPTVFSLYATGKTRTADLARLPFLAASLSNPDRPADEKALFCLHERWSHKLLASFPLRAVLLPRVTGQRDSGLCPASAAQGLNALAPSTLELTPAVEPETFRRLVSLVRRLPCYYLDLGTDPAQPAELILRFLQSGALPGAA